MQLFRDQIAKLPRLWASKHVVAKSKTPGTIIMPMHGAVLDTSLSIRVILSYTGTVSLCRYQEKNLAQKGQVPMEKEVMTRKR